MYDFAGEWLYAVGMPAKSVGGGILAVLPGQLGIGVFSPRLDARGNSMRGVAVCKELSRDFSLHFLRVPRSARTTIRGEYDLGQLYSRRLRTDAERATLEAIRGRVRTYALQGDLSFAAVEAFARRIVDTSATVDFMVVDLKRVTDVEACAVAVVARLVADLGALGKQVVFVGGKGTRRSCARSRWISQAEQEASSTSFRTAIPRSSGARTACSPAWRRREPDP
jgi:glutaminase